MSSLVYTTGDAAMPRGPGPKVIVHCVNDIGAWGAGFVLALREAWPKAEEAYRSWSHNKEDPQIEETGSRQLGEVQFVLVGPKLWVASLVGQIGVGRGDDGRPPVRYDAIRTGLIKINRFCRIHEATVHMPRMGSGLAGGNWTAIEQTVQAELAGKGVTVTVYDLP